MTTLKLIINTIYCDIKSAIQMKREYPEFALIADIKEKSHNWFAKEAL